MHSIYWLSKPTNRRHSQKKGFWKVFECHIWNEWRGCQSTALLHCPSVTLQNTWGGQKPYPFFWIKVSMCFAIFGSGKPKATPNKKTDWAAHHHLKKRAPTTSCVDPNSLGETCLLKTNVQTAKGKRSFLTNDDHWPIICSSPAPQPARLGTAPPKETWTTNNTNNRSLQASPLPPHTTHTNKRAHANRRKPAPP